MPAWGNFVLDKGFNAAAAITKFRAVKLSAEETVTPITASTDIKVGVAQFGVSTAEIAQGKGCSARVIGVTEWECNAAVAVGQEVMCHTNGTCTPATGAGNRVQGLCVGQATANAGERCTVLLYQGGRLI